MPDSLAEQIEKLRTALSILHSRRPVLGEGIEPAIAATQRELEALLGTVQHKIGSIVAAHGGMVAQYQGDGLMAFFGAQGLREEDVEQAIRAALEAQDAIPELNLQVPVQICGDARGTLRTGRRGGNRRKLVRAGRRTRQSASRPAGSQELL